METSDGVPLHRQNPVGRFTDRAPDYARFRPGYPEAAFDAMLDGLGEPTGLIAVDVGAGTGISARPLAARGVRVIALEPSAAMRAHAGPVQGDRIEWRDGRAERTSLENASADLVLCAQSFHWFDPAATEREFRRVLRTTGRLALLWNTRQSDDALTRGYTELIRELFAPKSGRHGTVAEEFFARASTFRNARRLDFRNEQSLDLDGLVGRAMSSSYVAREGVERDRMVEQLRELHARHADEAGRVTLVHTTQLWLADPA